MNPDQPRHESQQPECSDAAWWSPIWTRRRLIFSALAPVALLTVLVAAVAVYQIYFDRGNLPDLESFMQFEFSHIGRIYDLQGQPLVELAREYRQISQYEDIPSVLRDAILAAEDKSFFFHNGVNYSSLPRVLSKIRIGALTARLLGFGSRTRRAAVFPQGGSTITQQLVRGYFLRDRMVQENDDTAWRGGLAARALSCVIGRQNVKKFERKREEIRLSLWLEEQMRERFGSKRRAKEEILARYASLVYMGNGQYGFAAAAEYYFGRPLSTFTADDADKAALLAGIPKAAQYYAPTAGDSRRVLRRRNQILALMSANGFLSEDAKKAAEQRPFPAIARHTPATVSSSAVVEHVLAEVRAEHPDLTFDDLLRGSIQVYSTVDARVQRIANEALEHGLEKYERRHPSARGLVQGSVVVLKNADGSVLAETGGRQTFLGRSSSYSDFNRVRRALRQPGSAMKPIVYLAAFQHGDFTLATLVPDEPISVPNGEGGDSKWISNYDGRFKGLIPIREALAESRNAVAVWIVQQIGIDSVLRMSRDLGMQTPLRPYATTALGASEVSLLELATAYRAIASGVVIEPYVIRRIVRESGDPLRGKTRRGRPIPIADGDLSLIQEGLRGVVRIPTGTAHALDARGFPIAVMGKTGTTNEFRDALFLGSTYGADGITVGVRIGFDDNRSLGRNETGGRVALPVFQELMLQVYRSKLAGPPPAFPAQMEQSITRYLHSDGLPRVADATPPAAPPNSRAPERLPYQAAEPGVIAASLNR